MSVYICIFSICQILADSKKEKKSEGRLLRI